MSRERTPAQQASARAFYLHANLRRHQDDLRLLAHRTLRNGTKPADIQRAEYLKEQIRITLAAIANHNREHKNV